MEERNARLSLKSSGMGMKWRRGTALRWAEPPASMTSLKERLVQVSGTGRHSQHLPAFPAAQFVGMRHQVQLLAESHKQPGPDSAVGLVNDHPGAHLNFKARLREGAKG